MISTEQASNNQITSEDIEEIHIRSGWTILSENEHFESSLLVFCYSQQGIIKWVQTPASNTHYLISVSLPC